MKLKIANLKVVKSNDVKEVFSVWGIEENEE